MYIYMCKQFSPSFRFDLHSLHQSVGLRDPGSNYHECCVVSLSKTFICFNGFSPFFVPFEMQEDAKQRSFYVAAARYIEQDDMTQICF